MPKRSIAIWFRMLAFGAAVFLHGCSGGSLAQRVSEYTTFAKTMQPGHRYQSYTLGQANMRPAIPKNAIVLADYSAYESSKPQRGDIIVFRPPIESANPYVKRIAGLPGDRFSIGNGKIIVNGKALAPVPGADPPDYRFAVVSHGFKTYDDDMMLANKPAPSAWTAPDRLPDGCYFVIGDQANNSEDSHIFGCAQRDGAIWTGPLKGSKAEPFGKVVAVVPP
jgi:signal peptidase I